MLPKGSQTSRVRIMRRTNTKSDNRGSLRNLASVVHDDARRLDQILETSAALQPDQKYDARQGGQRADDEEHRPARALGDETRSGRKIGASNGGERREERVLRCRVQRVVAQG